MILNLPLEVWISKNKKFILNLNNYRNAHYMILSKAKKEYYHIIDSMIREKNLQDIRYDKVSLVYTLYPKSKRRIDTNNVCSIVDKFACDAITEFGLWEDDNYNIVKQTCFIYGEVDKNNPRCELEIINLLPSF